MELKEIPVGRCRNLIGQKFDHLTVKFRTEPPENSKKKSDTWWACECDCGNSELIRIRGDRFKSETHFSCGCDFKKIGRPIDNTIQIGQKYGKWTIKEFKGVIDTHASYLCECECGTQKILYGSALKRGETKSCQLCSLGHKLDITGQKFGKLTALEPTEKRSNSFVVWKCQCDCGNICEVSLGHLRNGDVKSCGCIGKSFGEYCIQQLLNTENITYTVQKWFDNCRFTNSNRPAKFDFYIEDKYIIEFDGEQHFHPKEHGYFTQEKFKEIREHDLFKNKYCFDNNIPLIRIPYDTKYDLNDLKLETTKFLLTPENEENYYAKRS